MMNSYTKRYIANIVIEANTPLKVGSSILDILQDSPVQKDFNDLPMILGTSIAGVLRKEFEEDTASEIFGNTKGSRIIISNALLCDENMQVSENLLLKKSKFLKLFDVLPQRQHTAITQRGVAKENSKFDEEVVYKGSRFKFRMEFLADATDEKIWDNIVSVINSKLFFLGSGSTKGFGSVKVLHKLSTYDIFDITSKEYADISSSLNNTFKKPLTTNTTKTNHIHYQLKITPEDFYIFGSGFGDDEADAIAVYEKVIDYDTKTLSKNHILIPASSIKGALAHRSVYHYNKLKGNTIEKGNGISILDNIFGEAKQSDTKSGKKGTLYIFDSFKPNRDKTQIFDHVSIDRFTGGGLDGALFQEKTISQKDDWEIDIYLKNTIPSDEIDAFEKALKDITTGMLQLGGMTTKGHGVFEGSVYKDGDLL